MKIHFGDRLPWDKYFLFLCKIVSSRSTCLSKKYGAVIVKDKRVLSTGYNGSPCGAEHCVNKGFCNKRSLGDNAGSWDNCLAVHAEINAIVSAAKNGTQIDGATLYVSVSPCFECLKIVMNSGIKKIVVGGFYRPNLEKYMKFCAKEKIDIQVVNISEADEEEMQKYVGLPFEHNLLG